MLHPSYNELIEKVNDSVENNEPIVNSRYSIVIAAAKRARQLIDEEQTARQKQAAGDKTVVVPSIVKPLSTAVEELYKGEVHIMGEEDVAEDEIQNI